MSALPMTEAEQREINHLCIQAGVMLLQHGAESALVESVTRRLGLAFKLQRVDVAVTANALTVTTSDGGAGITTVRRNEDQGINMHVLIEIQRIMLAAESGLFTVREVAEKLQRVQPIHHPRWLVVIVIGLSCACFARLAQADFASCVVTFFASALAMAVRQQFVRFHFSPLVNFFATAFVATSAAAQGLIYHWGENPKIAMAASCLLLVPGVPLINAVSDMVKGYINTGIARWTMASLLTFAMCAGIMLAMTVWKVWAWL